MADPYIPHNPGDLITAQDWNGVQEMIREDLEAQITEAVDGITNVAHSTDAEKVGGMTPDQLAQQVFEYVMRQLPKRTGYLSVFRKLVKDDESVIEHKLGACPLVDVYQLDYFPVAASEDGHTFRTLTTFYLHHANESRVKFRPDEPAKAPLESIETDPPKGHPFHIPFTEMLQLYGVEMHEDAPLGDIESEFWQAFNAAPNDRFDDDQYFHSPWFDRCCGENRTVRSLARDWDDIYFQCRPRKTINFAPAAGPLTAAPTQIQVVQFDLESVGLRLLADPVVPVGDKRDAVPTDHLKVLVLLKV